MTTGMRSPARVSAQGNRGLVSLTHDLVHQNGPPAPAERRAARVLFGAKEAELPADHVGGMMVPAVVTDRAPLAFVLNLDSP